MCSLYVGVNIFGKVSTKGTWSLLWEKSLIIRVFFIKLYIPRSFANNIGWKERWFSHKNSLKKIKDFLIVYLFIFNIYIYIFSPAVNSLTHTINVMCRSNTLYKTLTHYQFISVRYTTTISDRRTVYIHKYSYKYKYSSYNDNHSALL